MEKRSSGVILYDFLTALDESFGESKKDNIIDVNSMYGIFLPERNYFMICKESNYIRTDFPNLREFFTDELVAHGLQREENCPWRQGGEFTLDATKDLEMAFCVPVVDLLEKYSVDGVCNKKDIAYLYCNINEYLKENPNFIEQLLENEKKKIR